MTSNYPDCKTAYLDLRTELCDLRKRYLQSGWVDSGMEEGFDNLIDRLEQLENGETSTEAAVRQRVSTCVWFDAQSEGPEAATQVTDKMTKCFMRLIRHREGHHNVHS